MTYRTRQALAGITLAALIGLPAGLLFGRSTTAGANAPTTSVPDVGAPAAGPSTTLRPTIDASTAPTTTQTNAPTTVAPAASIARAASIAPTTTAAPDAPTTISASTPMSATPTTVAQPPSTPGPVDGAAVLLPPTPAAPAEPSTALSSAVPAPVPVVPDGSPAAQPTASATEVELTDPDMLGREISTEASMLAPGQIDRVSWVATPSVRRALVTVTVRFVGGGSVLAEYSADVRFAGRVDRAGSLRATVPDGATAIEIEWLSVGGPVDVHDIDVTAVETAPPSPYDQP